MEYAKAVSMVNKEEVETVLVQFNEELNMKKQSDKALTFESPFEEQV
ncbi:hypothetical protein [Neobacillus vireti]|nr:hypothetical protein [Neobacillus vireti]